MTDLALFAGDYVGREIARILFEEEVYPSVLFLSKENAGNYNSEILKILSTDLEQENVLYVDKILTADDIERLAGIEPDLGLLAWWPYIVKKEVIELFNLGCLNFHPSYLPHNRGKDPNFWTLKEGTPAGVTIHFIDENIDSGEIVFQRKIETDWTDTGKTLYEKSINEMIDLFRNNINKIKTGDLPRRPQIDEEGSFHTRAELDVVSEIKLDETYCARELLNLIRARTFKPHRGAWFEDDGEIFEVRVEIKRREQRKDNENAP